MATTMDPWVTMDTFVVHNTSPADSCKLDREGTPWSSQQTLKTIAVQAPFQAQGLGTCNIHIIYAVDTHLNTTVGTQLVS